MDCDKCNSLLLDELYGELDEVTSAAVKRHLAGCSSCSAKMDGLRGVRVQLAPALRSTPPVHLEHAIMARVHEAEKTLPLPEKVAPVSLLSRAGRWAMRPQTAMAAVFVVVIGTSTVFIGTSSMSKRAYDPTTAAGAPMAPGAAREGEALNAVATLAPAQVDSPQQAGPSGLVAPAPVASAAAPAAPALAAAEDTKGRDPATEEKRGKSAVADNAYGDLEQSNDKKKEAPKDLGSVDEREQATRRIAAGNSGAGGAVAKSDDGFGQPTVPRANAPAGPAALPRAPQMRPQPATAPAPPPPPRATKAVEDRDGVFHEEAAPAKKPSPSTPPAVATSAPMSAMDRGRALYEARKFDDALREFEAAAQQGNTSGNLWAARAAREGKGCGVAASRFDAATQQLRGSALENEATLGAASCYEQMGNFALARARYEALKSVPDYRARAEAGLARIAEAERRRPQAAPTSDKQ